MCKGQAGIGGQVSHAGCFPARSSDGLPGDGTGLPALCVRVQLPGFSSEGYTPGRVGGCLLPVVEAAAGLMGGRPSGPLWGRGDCIWGRGQL